ncbi:MAG: hypothetical protein R3E58_20155 [Phycisphaerae bacterium]
MGFPNFNQFNFVLRVRAIGEQYVEIVLANRENAAERIVKHKRARTPTPQGGVPFFWSFVRRAVFKNWNVKQNSGAARVILDKVDSASDCRLAALDATINSFTSHFLRANFEPPSRSILVQG